MTQFYSYLWLREDGSPYYAGKGKGDRAYEHNGHRVKPPKDKSRILIFPMLNEEEAFESEIALIELFGRKDLDPDGLLRNLTNGGEGSSGHIVSEETRAKTRAANMGHEVSPETRVKMSAAHKGMEFSPETCAKMSAANMGHEVSPEARAKISAVMIGNKNMLGHTHSPEARAKMSAAKKGKKLSPEHIAKISAAKKGKKHSPESRAKMIGNKNAKGNKNMLGHTHSPETRAKMSAANKGKKRSFLGLHTRWHVNKGITNPSCKLCAQSATDFEI